MNIWRYSRLIFCTATALLSACTPMNAPQDSNGHGKDHALWLALSTNNYFLVKAALAFGIDPNTMEKGKPLIYHALTHHWKNSALALVEGAADCRSGQGYNPQVMAAAQDLIDVLKACFHQHPPETLDVNEKLQIVEAISINGSPDDIRWAVAQGLPVTGHHSDGRSILHVFLGNTQHLHLENVKTLIDLGADLMDKSPRGELPSDYFFSQHSYTIYWTTMDDDNEVVAIWLLDKGLPPDKPSEKYDPRFTTAGSAAYWAVPEVITAILDSSSDASERARHCAEISAGLTMGAKNLHSSMSNLQERRERTATLQEFHDATRDAAKTEGCAIEGDI